MAGVELSYGAEGWVQQRQQPLAVRRASGDHTREAARRSHRLRPQGLKEASFTQSRSHWEKPNTRLSERIGDPRLCTIGLPSITFLFFP